MLRVRVQHAGDVVGPALSTFYFTGGTQTEADDAAVAVATAMVALEPAIVAGATWEMEPAVAEMDPATGEILGLFSVTGANGVGSDSSQQLPAATQGLVQLRTGVFASGREVRGRLFIPGPAEGANTGSKPTTGYKAVLSTALNGLISDADSVYVVWSRTHGTTTAVLVATIWDQWAVLRSRRD